MALEVVYYSEKEPERTAGVGDTAQQRWLLASAAWDGCIKLWRPETENTGGGSSFACVRTINAHKAEVGLSFVSAPHSELAPTLSYLW